MGNRFGVIFYDKVNPDRTAEPEVPDKHHGEYKKQDQKSKINGLVEIKNE